MNGMFASIQAGNPRQFKMYGDSIYPLMSHLKSRHGATTGLRRMQDIAMSSCRESIEWHYGQAGSLLTYLNSPYRLHIKGQYMPLQEIYFCQVLLRNCHVCLYHNETSEGFNCALPTLAEYLV
jgi:hypothetical protein